MAGDSTTGKTVRGARGLQALRRGRKLLIYGGCLAGMTLYGLWLGRDDAGGEGNSGGPLAVEADDLDLGEVWIQQEFRRPVTLTNRSGGPLTIQRFSASCDCTAVEPSSLRLEPGGSATIRVTIDLTRQIENGQTAGDVAVRLTAHYLDGDGVPGQTRWQLRGRVRRLVLRPRGTLHFGEPQVLGTSVEPRSWDVVCHPAVERLTAHCDRSFADAELRRVSIEQPRFRLTVRPRQSLPVGMHRFPVVLSGTDAAGWPLPETRLGVYLPVVRDVRLEPPMLTFGLVPAGREAEETVTVRSRTGRPFEVLAVVPTDELPVQVEPVTAAEDTAAPQLYRVRLAAERPESGTGEIVFRVRSEEGEDYELPLPVTWVNGGGESRALEEQPATQTSNEPADRPPAESLNDPRQAGPNAAPQQPDGIRDRGHVGFGNRCDQLPLRPAARGGGV